MDDLLESDLFHDVKHRIMSIVEQIKSADNLLLVATADLESILAMANIESALIDSKIPYSRRVLNSITHQPKGEPYHIESTGSLTVSIEQYEETWDSNEIDDSDRLRIVPLTVLVSHSNSSKRGALDVVIQSAAIAAALSPNGARVRRIRPLAGIGHWLRESLDTSYDPVHSKIRDLLRDEGSIRLVPLPEVESAEISMIPGMSKSVLKRLSSKWSKMDFEQRSQAMSELVLPTLENSNLSTPRLEELIWYRVIFGGSKIDLHSQVYLTKDSWPEDIDVGKSHAAMILKRLITTGQLLE